MADANKAHRLLNAVTATGAGAAVNLEVARKTFGIQVSHTGSPTTVTVVLEGSINGNEWDTLVSHNGTQGLIVYAVDKPVTQIRANLTTLTGGTSPTVTAWATAA